MQLINGFKDYTKSLFEKFHSIDPGNRSVWTPACPFHGNEHFGTLNDTLTAAYQVPESSGNTLGKTLYDYHFNKGNGVYIDQVNWPQNTRCAHVFG